MYPKTIMFGRKSTALVILLSSKHFIVKTSITKYDMANHLNHVQQPPPEPRVDIRRRRLWAAGLFVELSIISSISYETNLRSNSPSAWTLICTEYVSIRLGLPTAPSSIAALMVKVESTQFVKKLCFGVNNATCPGLALLISCLYL